jgi:tRNA dimethylallyltransferase
MDIGTGKDLDEYGQGTEQIPYHLIDIADPGDEYNLYRYQCDFVRAFNLIVKNSRLPVLCGGTGLYLDAILRNYELSEVPPDTALRKRLNAMSLQDLVNMLKELGEVHNNTDTEDRERAIRAIEIRMSPEKNVLKLPVPDSASGILSNISPIVFLLAPEDRQILRDRISKRLSGRLNNGLVEEVQRLIEKGVPLEMLDQYGLEYRFVANYLMKKIDFESMHSLLETSINQFAARQLRWFRRMERKGVNMIHVDSEATFDKIISRVLDHWHTKLKK